MKDIYHDPAWGTLRHLLQSNTKIASEVRNHEVVEDADKLAATAFADPSRRLFPIYEKGAAILSYAYARTQDVPKATMSNIKEALAAYEVDMSIFDATSTKEAAAPKPEECLFPDLGLWPVRNATEVKTAEVALVQERTKLMPEARAAAYVRLYKMAQSHNVSLHPDSLRYAGLVETDTPALRDALRSRAVLAEKNASVSGAVKEKIATAYEKLASELESAPRRLRDRQLQAKIASAVSELDNASGLLARYDRGVPDPMRTVFNTEKVALATDIELGGKSFAISKLASLPASFYADALGEDFARELAPGGEVSSSKIAEVLPTLPMVMKRVLAIALRSTGT